MMSAEGKRFIESSKFPVALVSAASAKEKQGGGRPSFWEMVFWWTRKPLASARAVIAGCLLPENVNVDEFVRALRLNEKVTHRHRPMILEKWRQYFEGKRLLDPFAGFGSIPLEAMRLGLDATAVELLPSSYVLLKGALDYPKKYGEQLLKDVEYWGEWVTEKLREDPVIKKLYDPDVAVYIGSWEIKCPHCGKWTPLIGNFWLARIKDKKGEYRRLAWMEIVKDDSGELSVLVKDLNKELRSLENVKVDGNKVKTPKVTFVVPTANISPRSEQATCLNSSCNGNIRYIDTETGKHYVDPNQAPDKQRVKWYAKYALAKYNNGDSNFARLRLLVKLKANGANLEFEPCKESDQKTLEEAKQEVEKLLLDKDPDIPTEPISLYSVRYLFPILYGITQWYQLFNPRQLFTLIKIARLIRRAGDEIKKGKLKEGKAEPEAVHYAEAVVTYLSMAFLKFLNYNTLTTWVHASNPWGVDVSPTLATRGIAMQWNWCEISPFVEKGISGILKTPISWIRSSHSSIEGLRYLVSVLCDGSTDLLGSMQSNNSKINVLLDDATVLIELKNEQKFDLIITDPPYYDDVPYTELSDFYYVWLKRTLSDAKNGKLAPKFHTKAFFRTIGDQLIEVRTQWEEFASREVSLNPPRLGESVDYKEGVDYFQKLLDASFLTMRNLLKEDGVLATYYAHTDPEAWKALLRSGWESGGLSIGGVFPVATESLQSVVKRGKLSLDTSMVVVWKGFASDSVQASRLYEVMVNSSAERARILIDMNIGGRDLFVGTLAGALSVATRYKDVMEMKKLDTSEIVDKYVYPATLYGLVKAITKKANVEEGVKSNETMLYLVVKTLSAGAKQKMITSNDARIFSIGTGVDLSYVARNLKMFRIGGKDQRGEGTSLAKRKTLILLEPLSEERVRVKDFLDYRELDPENPRVRCSVDVLHLLEYYAISYGKEQFASKLDDLRKKHPAEVDEAITLARVISGSLADDIEAKLCSKIVDKIAYYKPSQQPLTEYIEGEK